MSYSPTLQHILGVSPSTVADDASVAGLLGAATEVVRAGVDAAVTAAAEELARACLDHLGGTATSSTAGDGSFAAVRASLAQLRARAAQAMDGVPAV